MYTDVSEEYAASVFCVEFSEVRVRSGYIARLGGMNVPFRITAEGPDADFSRSVGMPIRIELQKNSGKVMLRVS